MKLYHVIKSVLPKRKAILALAQKHSTPFYVFDKPEAIKSIQEFKSVFTKYIPDLDIYYAVKSNPYDGLLKTVVQNNLGLDVSSSRELKLALKSGVKKLIFSGPGKTLEELKMAIAHRHKLILHLDSPGELKKLGNLLKNKRLTIRAGVRIYTKYHDTWTKFGIDLQDLSAFFDLAQKYPQISLQGIQCHMSWNKTPQAYQNMILEISKTIKKLPKNYQQKIKFIDFGGGFEPHNLEGYLDPKNKNKYYITKTVKLTDYARAISQSINKYIRPQIDCQFFCEPGRAISTKSMHLALGVADVKKRNIAILDAGINMVGYELFEEYYYPTINLSQPSRHEIRCRLYGSLCTPDDMFGYFCYAKSIKEGDIIMIPYQGAYIYTLAQDFIKGIPPVYHI